LNNLFVSMSMKPKQGTVANCSKREWNDESPTNATKKKTKTIDDPLGNENIATFLRKTYKMINGCDPSIASWTENGEKIEIKDTKRFSTSVIPNFFDHKNLKSFERQLNFYGFKKIPLVTLRKTGIETNKIKSITFYNPKFKRDEPELMIGISRSTASTKKSGPDLSHQEKEIAELKEKLCEMEKLLFSFVETVNTKLSKLPEQSEQFLKENPELRVSNPTKQIEEVSKMLLDPFHEVLPSHEDHELEIISLDETRDYLEDM